MDQYLVVLIAVVGSCAAVILTKARPIDLVVVGLPVAGVVGGTLEANVSPADAVLPFALLAALRSARWGPVPSDDRAQSLRTILLVCLASLVLLAGLAWRTLASPLDTDFSYGMAAVVKLWVGLAYLGLFAHHGMRLFTSGDRLLMLWSGVATLAAGAGLLGVGLYAVGVETSLTLSFRATGGFDDPNLFASYLLVSIPLTFVAGTTSAIRYPLAMIAVQSLALVLTGSRAALPALGVGVLGALLLGRGRLVAPLVLKWGTSLALVGVVLAWRFPSLTGLDAVARLRESSVSVEGDVRLLLWQTAYRMWLDHPIFGVGIGQFIIESPHYVAGGLSNIPHSTHLGLLAETGLLGWAAVMSVPLMLLWRLVGTARRTLDPAPTWLILGLASSLAMALTLNLENFRGLWAYLGLCLAYVNVLRRPAAKQSPRAREPVGDGPTEDRRSSATG